MHRRNRKRGKRKLKKCFFSVARMDEQRVCSGCLERKGISEFGKLKRGPGGYSCKCKECTNSPIRKKVEIVEDVEAISIPNSIQIILLMDLEK